MVVHIKYNCGTLFQLILGSVSTALLSYDLYITFKFEEECQPIFLAFKNVPNVPVTSLFYIPDI